MAASALGPLRPAKHKRHLVGQTLLRELVREGLDLDALPAAAALVVEMDEIAREDAVQRRERAARAGRATQARRRAA